MKDRCFNKDDENYNRYGGRGTTISESWLTLESFIEDILKEYNEFEKINGENSATIDKMDFNGNYCKENCR